MIEFFHAGPDATPTPVGGILQMPQWTGTSGDDTLTDPNRAGSELIAGVGDDVIFAGAGADEAHGGAGDDLLYGGSEDDVLVPGFGFDFVYGEGGDDTILISGTCELESGEVVDGGPGYDVLYSPISSNALAQAGVSVISIEEIILTHPQSEAYTCTPPLESPGLPQNFGSQ
jgi:hypothetical protein